MNEDNREEKRYFRTEMDFSDDDEMIGECKIAIAFAVLLLLLHDQFLLAASALLHAARFDRNLWNTLPCRG